MKLCKIQPVNNESILDFQDNLMDDLMIRLMNAEHESESAFLTYFLKKNADPKIKGDITKGKLKWRGIKKCTTFEDSRYISWIEQRGKRISDFYVREPLVGATTFNL